MKPRPTDDSSECLRDALFSTKETWKNQNYTRKNFSEECNARTIISTECFLGFFWLFKESFSEKFSKSRKKNIEKKKLTIEKSWKMNNSHENYFSMRVQGELLISTHMKSIWTILFPTEKSRTIQKKLLYMSKDILNLPGDPSPWGLI